MTHQCDGEIGGDDDIAVRDVAVGRSPTNVGSVKVQRCDAVKVAFPSVLETRHSSTQQVGVEQFFVHKSQPH